MPQRSKCNPNLFCYVCGKCTTSKHLKPVTKTVELRYNQYFFPVKFGDQSKNFAPQRFCVQCICSLSNWSKGESKRKKYFLFDWPMTWREITNHHDDCFFCMNMKGLNCKRRKTKLKAVSSVTLPSGDGCRVPLFPVNG